MAFSGMEARFNAKMKAIYDAHSTTDGSKDGQPFLEIKPDNPQYDVSGDTFSLPINSIKRDSIVVNSWLKSGDGLLFLGKQALLQTGNSISETRLLNPLFVTANLQPFVHFDRSVSSPSDFSITDPSAAPDSLDPRIGFAGRLQSETANAALARVVGTSGVSGLVGLLSLSGIVSTLTSAFHVGSAGSTGVDERPELNVDGTFYSVQMNRGFTKKISPQNYYDSALKSLKSGNIQGAYSSVKGAVNAAEGIASSVVSAASSLLHGDLSGAARSLNGNTVNDSIDSNAQAGSRYFITNKTDATRYLRGSVDQNGIGTAWYLDHRPNVLAGLSAVPFATATPAFGDPITPVSAVVEGSDSSINLDGQNITLPDLKVAVTPGMGGIESTVAAVQKDAQQSLDDDVRAIRGQIVSTIPHVSIDGIDLTALTLPLSNDTNTENPAEDNMTFGNLSLTSRYNDDHFSTVRDAITNQVTKQTSYWNRSDVDTGNMGFTGGLKAGAISNNLNPNVRSKIGSYLKDGMNKRATYKSSNGNLSVSDSTRKQIRDDANDSIMVMFQDYENNVVIPFRAFITGISESIRPEVSDTRYVGRIERNIVYVGVSRSVSFQLRVQAFSSEELNVVWKKIEYLSSLCYPSGYSNGFMVPPLIKLSLGDMYRDQPGYFSSITNTVEQDTSWEITDGHMLPHGMLIDVQFAIIEKTQIKSGSKLYGKTPFSPQK